MRIAILGATSQIAKNLISYFLKDSKYELFLFARNTKAVHEFIMTIDSLSIPFIFGFEEFPSGKYDVVINCIGIGDPRKLREAGVGFFRITEYFDNLVIDYLLNNKNTTYINFSSGAVYGTEFDSGVTEDSIANIAVNKIIPADFYRIGKLNAEVKHRALIDQNIIDLRIFSFFSQFIDLNSGFLLCELVRSVIANTIFHTNAVEIIRDYIAPSDLFTLVELCLINQKMNCAIDVYSAKVVQKSELIELFKHEYGLTSVIEDKDCASMTGTKLAYYSSNPAAFSLLSYVPTINSIDTVRSEVAMLLARSKISTNTNIKKML